MYRFIQIATLIVLAGPFLFLADSLAQTKSSPDIGPEIEAKPLPAPEAPSKTKPSFELEKDLDGLFRQLKRAQNPKRSSRIADAIWEKWYSSDSRSVDLLSGWARTAIGKRDFGPALDLIDQVIVLRPQYAEGYNQRATLHFMMENYGKSIADIESTLALEPRHFGALSGLGMIFERVDRKKDALKAWSRALEVYPAMKNAQDAVIRLEEDLAGSGI